MSEPRAGYDAEKCAVCGDDPTITKMSDYDKFYEAHFGQNA